MSRLTIARYVIPWKFRREQEQRERLQALRGRDGDDCRRCRRPMRFDLPEGHDLSAKIEEMPPPPVGAGRATDHLGLCHCRCHSSGVDHTDEVAARIRRKNEAALLPKSRKRKARAA